MAVSLDEFVKDLENHGILAADKLEEFLPPQGHPSDALDLARQLVRRNKLSKYQAQEIYQGKAGTLVLGSYVILDKIGSGRWGEVYQARHAPTDRVVALKVLPASLTGDANAVARLRDDIAAAARVAHPSFVATQPPEPGGDVLLLVMDYVPAGSLLARVREKGPLATEKAVIYILQVARALEAAHAQNVVHGGLRPGHLLLDKSDAVHILGLGRAAAEPHDFDFVAPEQAGGTSPAEVRSDIYSLGCILYYLLAASTPFSAHVAGSAADELLPSLRLVRPEISTELDGIFQRMAAKLPADRYQTMSDVVHALEKCQPVVAILSGAPPLFQPLASVESELSIAMTNRPLRSVATASETPQPAPEPPPRKRGRSLWIVLAAAVVLLGLAAGLALK